MSIVASKIHVVSDLTVILGTAKVKAMKRIAFFGLFLLIIGAISYYFLRRDDKTPRLSATPTPSIVPGGQVQGRFDAILPLDGKKSPLIDISGGDASGAVSLIEHEKNLTVIVYADLPQLENGFTYQVWLVEGETRKPIGALHEAKGGWLLEEIVSRESAEKLLVSRERTIDSEIEQVILEARL